MEERVQISVPQGYCLVKSDNNTYKLVKKRCLPYSWEEFVKEYPTVDETWYVATHSSILKNTKCYTEENEVKVNELFDKNLLDTQDEAIGILALCQLIRLRNCYWQDWRPKLGPEPMYAITFRDNVLIASTVYHCNEIFVFDTMWKRDKFMMSFKDLLMEYFNLCKMDK